MQAQSKPCVSTLWLKLLFGESEQYSRGLLCSNLCSLFIVAQCVFHLKREKACQVGKMISKHLTAAWTETVATCAAFFLHCMSKARDGKRGTVQERTVDSYLLSACSLWQRVSFFWRTREEGYTAPQASSGAWPRRKSIQRAVAFKQVSLKII